MICPLTRIACYQLQVRSSVQVERFINITEMELRCLILFTFNQHSTDTQTDGSQTHNASVLTNHPKHIHIVKTLTQPYPTLQITSLELPPHPVLSDTSNSLETRVYTPPPESLTMPGPVLVPPQVPTLVPTPAPPYPNPQPPLKLGPCPPNNTTPPPPGAIPPFKIDFNPRINMRLSNVVYCRRMIRRGSRRR